MEAAVAVGVGVTILESTLAVSRITETLHILSSAVAFCRNPHTWVQRYPNNGLCIIIFNCGKNGNNLNGHQQDSDLKNGDVQQQ